MNSVKSVDWIFKLFLMKTKKWRWSWNAVKCFQVENKHLVSFVWDRNQLPWYFYEVSDHLTLTSDWCSGLLQISSYMLFRNQDQSNVTTRIHPWSDNKALNTHCSLRLTWFLLQTAVCCFQHTSHPDGGLSDNMQQLQTASHLIQGLILRFCLYYRMKKIRNILTKKSSFTFFPSVANIVTTLSFIPAPTSVHLPAYLSWKGFNATVKKHLRKFISFNLNPAKHFTSYDTIFHMQIQLIICCSVISEYKPEYRTTASGVFTEIFKTKWSYWVQRSVPIQRPARWTKKTLKNKHHASLSHEEIKTCKPPKLSYVKKDVELWVRSFLFIDLLLF